MIPDRPARGRKIWYLEQGNRQPMRRTWNIVGGLCAAVLLLAHGAGCSNNNTPVAPINALPEGTSPPLQSPPAQDILVQFTQLARAGDLDALTFVLQDIFAAGGFRELVDALSVVLTNDRVDELARIMGVIIDRGTVFEFTPIASDLLITFAADRDPATPGIQSAYDVFTQLFESGALSELIVPLRNLLAPEFPQDNPYVPDPRVEVIQILLDILETLGSQGLQDLLDQFNLALQPYSQVLPPRQAFLVKGNNGTLALFTAVSGTTVDDPANGPPPSTGDVVPLDSTNSIFRISSADLIPVFGTAASTCTGTNVLTSDYQKAYKVRFTTGLNAGNAYNVVSIAGATQLGICDVAYGVYQRDLVRITLAQVIANAQYTVTVDGTPVLFTSDATPTADEITTGLKTAINLLALGMQASSAGGDLSLVSDLPSTFHAVTAAPINPPPPASVPPAPAATTVVPVPVLADDTSFRFDIRAVVPGKDSSGTVIGNAVLPVGAALYALHGQQALDKDFVEAQVRAGDVVRFFSGVNSGLSFKISVDAGKTLDPGHLFYGELLYLATSSTTAEPYRGQDLEGSSRYFIAESRDPNLLFDLTDLNLVRDVLPIIERVVSGKVRPDSETLIELLMLVDLIPGSEFQGDDNVSAIEALVLASARGDVNKDGFLDPADNLDRDGNNGCRDPLTGAYVFWQDGMSTQCAPDFMDVNNDGVVQAGETFDINGDGIFDSNDFSRQTLTNSDYCVRAASFDTENIQSQGPGACPPGDGYVDCDLFTDPLVCRVFDTNNDGQLDSADSIPSVIDASGRVGIANGFSTQDRYPDGAPDGKIDWRDVFNSRSVTPENFSVPTSANPLTPDDHLPRLAQSLADTLLEAYRTDAGPSTRRGAQALLFALDNPTNIFIKGKSLPLITMSNLGKVLTTQDINGEFIAGPALQTGYSLASDGLPGVDGIRGNWAPTYFPQKNLAGNFVPKKADAGSSVYQWLALLDTLLKPVTINGEFGGPKTFPYGTVEGIFKDAFAAFSCTDPSVPSADCLAASPSNRLISGIEKDPVGNINQSFIRLITCHDDNPLDPAFPGTATCPPGMLPRATPVRSRVGAVQSQLDFFNLVVNNTSGGDLDNVVTFPDADFRQAVPGDFLIFADTPLPTAVCGNGADPTDPSNPTALARVVQPELGPQYQVISPDPAICDQFQTYDWDPPAPLLPPAYRDNTIDIDLNDPVKVASLDTEEELKSVCGQRDLVCFKVLQVLTRDTVLVGLDIQYEADANQNGVPDASEAGAVDPADLFPMLDPLAVPGGRYYGFLGNYLVRLPRQVFQIFQFHQESGQIPTFDGLLPNFDFSNAHNELALANTAPDFRPSIWQQLTLMLPIIDIDQELTIQFDTDSRAVDLSGLTTQQQGKVCPVGSVPMLSCGAAFQTNPYRRVNENLPNDEFLFGDPQFGSDYRDIPFAYDDNLLCVPGRLTSGWCTGGAGPGQCPSSLAVAPPLSAFIEETNVLAGFDPLNPLLDTAQASLCTVVANQGPPTGAGNCPAGAGACLGAYHIQRVANVLARLIPVMADLSSKTARQLIDDTQALAAPLLQGGVLSVTDRDAVQESLDSVAAVARMGVVPALTRIAQIIARPNVENVDVQSAAIVGVRVLSRRQQLPNGEITNNRVALKRLEPNVAAIFNPQSGFGADMISLILAIESTPVSTVTNYVGVEYPILGLPCDPNVSSYGSCVNLNTGPELAADFLKAVASPGPLKRADGSVVLDADGNTIPVRALDGLLSSGHDLLGLAVNCIHGRDEYGNGVPIFNCTSPVFPTSLTRLGGILRDVTVILGKTLQSEDFAKDVVPFFGSVLQTVVNLLDPPRGNRQENPTLSALRLFLSDTSLEAGKQAFDAFQALNQSDRAEFLRFTVDQFDPDTGAVAALIAVLDPILRNDPNGGFAQAVSELIKVNPNLPSIDCSKAQSVAGRVVDCFVKVQAGIPTEDIRFLFDTYVELVDTGSAQAIVNILAQLVTTGGLERLTPTLLLMAQEGVLNESIIFLEILMRNGIIGVNR